jgi:hypothetical protein
LSLQYRMNEEIMKLSNTLTYSNRLRCGNEQVAKVCCFVLQRPLQVQHMGIGFGTDRPCTGSSTTVVTTIVAIDATAASLVWHCQ